MASTSNFLNNLPVITSTYSLSSKSKSKNSKVNMICSNDKQDDISQTFIFPELYSVISILLLLVRSFI